ncbi:MAG: ThuA domain-containing protein [Spirochaetales bacterium]|nr:ThuA domain-containing protein [Spirochaetales bacterium]
MNKTCLAIIGDYWHKADEYRPVCEKVFPDHSIRYAIDSGSVPWENLDGFAVIILTKMGILDPTVSKDLWYTPEQEQELCAYVQNGGRLLVLHAGLADYPRDGLFRSVTKGAFLYHPQEHPVFTIAPPLEYKGRQTEFSDTRFSIQDEMYFVHVDADQTEVLLESRSPDYGSSPAVWRHSREKGRVFCATPGHNRAVLQSPEFLDMLDKGIRWLVQE